MGDFLLKVATLNCNGIRSAARKGLYAWLRSQDFDVICLQETKAQEHQLPLEAAVLSHYTAVFLDAEKRGYSGVAMYARREPERIVRGLGWPEFDAEARWLQFDYPACGANAPLSIASLYVPSGSMGPARQAVKEVFLELFMARLHELRDCGRSFLIAGDFNVAHEAIDVYNPVRCSNISGFFPHERAWIDAVFTKVGWVDAFRMVNREPNQFTWWSNFQRAFEHNRGWRIDYQLVTPDLGQTVRRASIYKNERFSDHAPVLVEYEMSLA